MGAQELRKLLEETEDKFGIFADREKLVKYSFNVIELSNLVKDFLTDDEKLKLFEFNHFKNANTILKSYIINTISDDDIKVKLIIESDIASNFEKYQLVNIIKNLNDNSKIDILKNSEFLKNKNLSSYETKDIINTLGVKARETLLEDKNLLEEDLEFKSYEICKLVEELESEDKKLQMIELYNISQYEIVDVLKTFSNESKRKILIENKYGFNKNEVKSIVNSFDNNTLIDFIKNNKEILENNNIEPYEIIINKDSKFQTEFITHLEEIGLNNKQKKQILATLEDETKESIDKINFSKDYLNALEMKVNKDTDVYQKIIVDYNKDLEKYKDLDELLYVKPTDISNENREKLFKLCDICPEIKIRDDMNMGFNTSKEYKNAEMWIDSVLENINENWCNIQKVAYIDNAIGKKISYSPDFDTEVFNAGDCRALWKIVDSGYGVCNGISQVEKYILDKIGIESEIISSGGHTFLKLKNITLPTKDGNEITGDTILDPTWNLTSHRYGGKPENFCRSYEQIRKHDIDSSGKDRMCHKNDEDLASATLELDEECLREVFKSIGVADKEGKFPIKKLIDESDKIFNLDISKEEMLEKQFKLLSEYYPDFAKCKNSTSSVLQNILLNHENLKFNRCVVSRVYDKNDDKKSPVLYTYIDLPGTGNKFYFADENSTQFTKLSKDEFEARFECYEMDMEKTNGLRDWEIDIDIEEPEDLARSSGKVVANEGEER